VPVSGEESFWNGLLVLKKAQPFPGRWVGGARGKGFGRAELSVTSMETWRFLPWRNVFSLLTKPIAASHALPANIRNEHSPCRRRRNCCGPSFLSHPSFWILPRQM
jgi:hypothetical protein